MSKKDLQYYLSLPYKIEMEFIQEDKTWMAYHPELGKGTCYSIGNSPNEALELLKDAKKEILEYAIEEGEDIPLPVHEKDLPSGQLALRIPRSLHQKLKEKAEADKVSLNALISNTLSEFYGRSKI